VDQVLFPELQRSDVVLTNGSGVSGTALAEFVIAAMLSFAKDIRRMVRNQMSAKWERFTVSMLSDATVGILGYGDIGRSVAARAHALGMNVLTLKRNKASECDCYVQEVFGAGQLMEVLPSCDYIVLTMPLTHETHA